MEKKRKDVVSGELVIGEQETVEEERKEVGEEHEKEHGVRRGMRRNMEGERSVAWERYWGG